MKKVVSSSYLILAGALIAALSCPVAAAPSGYRTLGSATLGGDGGWDYLNIDPASGNLFITRGTHMIPVSGTFRLMTVGP